MKKFRQALREAEKAAKHFFNHSVISSHKTRDQKDDAFIFRKETARIIVKYNKAPTKLYEKRGL